MPSDFSFRLSTYLSLALAAGCLGYAEADLLPSGAVIAGLVVALLAASFRLEGRFELGLAAANRLGVVLFVLAGVWLVTQFANRDSLIYTVPWPASLLPYIGTMLLVAMPAKLLRPKHAGDWWALQGMGLAAVGLACSLADDWAFGGLLALYAVTAVGGLSLFYLKREAGHVPPAPADPGLAAAVERLTGWRPGGGGAAPPAVVASAPARVRGAWRPAVGWLLVALAVALPLFFLTPRSGAARWSLTGVALETGYDSPQMTDLTRTGELRVNRDVAFEVRVTDAAGRPHDRLRPDQRWRGVAFGQYEQGKWRGTAVLRLLDPGDQAMPDQVNLVPAGPPAVAANMLVAEYTPQTRTSEPPVADPVRWQPGAGGPVWAAPRPGTGRAAGLPWIQKPDGTFNSRFAVPGGGEKYVQLLYPAPAGDPDLGTGFRPYQQAGPDPTRPLRELPAGLTELPARTRRLLDALVAAGTVPARATASPEFRRDGTPAPADWEAVARGFAAHLSAGGYAYTLKLRRQDKGSDPIEDFLYRTKAGNCERFAAGLVLMLRAVGVPARYVLGFKGHDPQGDGRYLVRQDHAHAWAEVLVPRDGPDGRPRWHWLSVDPTPDTGDEPADDTSLLANAAKTGQTFFDEFIVGYNADRRKAAAAGLTQVVTGPEFLLGLGGVLSAIGSGAVAWRLVRAVRRRRIAPEPAAVPWYDRLERTLAAAGLPPAPGATPREHAAAAAGQLPPPLAAAHARLVELFYHTRYGRRPLTPAEQAEVDDGLTRLAAELTPARVR